MRLDVGFQLREGLRHESVKQDASHLHLIPFSCLIADFPSVVGLGFVENLRSAACEFFGKFARPYLQSKSLSPVRLIPPSISEPSPKEEAQLFRRFRLEHVHRSGRGRLSRNPMLEGHPGWDSREASRKYVPQHGTLRLGSDFFNRQTTSNIFCLSIVVSLLRKTRFTCAEDISTNEQNESGRLLMQCGTVIILKR